MKLSSCFIVVVLGLSITSHCPAQNKDSVIVLPVRVAAPDNAKKLGSIRVGNNATQTHCDYEEVVRSAKEQARTMGGNIVKITQLIEPAFISKCYSIKADVYTVAQLPDYHLQATKNEPLSLVNNSYALLYVYRLKDTGVLAGTYKLHLNNDSVICNVKSKTLDSIKIYKEGPVTLWGDIEKREELKLNVVLGNTYYVRCGVKRGSIRMVPVIELVDKSMGEAECDKLKKGKKDMDVKYLKQIH